MEIGSYIKENEDIEIQIISIPVDYGLPLNNEGKEKLYGELIKDITEMSPMGVGISCTAIAQAEETIELCERIKVANPEVFIFLGGYFPTLYYEEILNRTAAIDLIVIGEGENAALMIIRALKKGRNPRKANIPNCVWKENGKINIKRENNAFNFNHKAFMRLELLKTPKSYSVLPYSFSRGCPYHCSFCMEEYIRPVRREVPLEILKKDLMNLTGNTDSRHIMISDALFKSFKIFPFLRVLGLKANFETRCDLMDASLLSKIAGTCGILALGCESASYSSLKRMNKIKDKEHYQFYLNNTKNIFIEAVRNNISIIVFFIAGYPGDKEEDLEQTLEFVRELTKYQGEGGYVFKIGECRAYPKTKIYDYAKSDPEVFFDDDGVFGQNVVRRPSVNLDFERVLVYMREIFNLSSFTDAIQNNILEIMPFFRVPTKVLVSSDIPDDCFKGSGRNVLDVSKKSLAVFKGRYPQLLRKYKDEMSDQRSSRTLTY